MSVGDPGVEQFRNAIMECRNLHVAAGLAPLMLLREEVTTNDELSMRGGVDNPTRDHFLQLLISADKWRRRVSHNPDKLPLGDLIQKAIDPKSTITDSLNPFAGDDIQMASGGMFMLPWDLSGGDENIPLASQLDLASGNGLILLGMVDRAIVGWTRLNSRDRTRFITQKDSLRIYALYQEIYAYLQTFAGDNNRVDVAQVRATDEPRGPENAPNRRTETAGGTTRAS